MKEPIKVYSNESIINYCNKHSISITEFNEPVIIPEEVTDYREMLNGCKSLNRPLTIPKGIIDEIYEIKNRSFNCLSLDIENLRIPDGVTEIKSNAFTLCRSLKSVIIPEKEGISYILFSILIQHVTYC